MTEYNGVEITFKHFYNNIKEEQKSLEEEIQGTIVGTFNLDENNDEIIYVVIVKKDDRLFSCVVYPKDVISYDNDKYNKINE